MTLIDTIYTINVVDYSSWRPYPVLMLEIILNLCFFFLFLIFQTMYTYVPAKSFTWCCAKPIAEVFQPRYSSYLNAYYPIEDMLPCLWLFLIMWPRYSGFRDFIVILSHSLKYPRVRYGCIYGILKNRRYCRTSRGSIYPVNVSVSVSKFQLCITM